MTHEAEIRRIADWLRTKLRLEMLLQGIIGSALLGLAAVILTIMAGIVSALVVASGGNLLESSLGVGLGGNTKDPLVFEGVFAVIFALWLLVAARMRHRLESLGKRAAYPRTTDHHLFDAASDLGGEIFSAGPKLLLRAEESFSKFIRLARTDIPRAAEILLWLFDRRHKASVEEIAEAFPGVNIISVIPQFRDIPGVIWLVPRRGVILVSQELREELGRLCGRARRVAPEPPPAEPRFRPEVLEWYEVLGLPAFASLQDVKKRYRQLAKQYHPDAAAGRGGLRTVNADESMKRINFAYHEILKSARS